METIKIQGKTRVLVKDKNGKRHVFDLMFEQAEIKLDEKGKMLELKAYDEKPVATKKAES